MPSTTIRGNYYKRKTKQYYESLGYTVQLTEFSCATMMKGTCIYRKIDIFGSDMIAMNGSEILFINSKYWTTRDSRWQVINGGKKEFEKYPFPPSVKRILCVWEPRKKEPEIIEVI